MTSISWRLLRLKASQTNNTDKKRGWAKLMLRFNERWNWDMLRLDLSKAVQAGGNRILQVKKVQV